jgi:hypothetical protein
MSRAITPSGRDIVRRDAVFNETREAWLQTIIDVWRPYFARLGYKLPPHIWISVGRPPSSRWTGVCYPGQASDDGNPQIFVNPVIADSTRAAGVVVHQLCHLALGNRAHGPAFKRLATTAGLIGKMTETLEGPRFQQVMPGIIDQHGPYPHSALRQLRGLDKKPPGSRLIRARCIGCGYNLRVTNRWLTIAVPVCPNPQCEVQGEPMEIG